MQGHRGTVRFRQAEGNVAVPKEFDSVEGRPDTYIYTKILVQAQSVRFQLDSRAPCDVLVKHYYLQSNAVEDSRPYAV